MKAFMLPAMLALSLHAMPALAEAPGEQSAAETATAQAPGSSGALDGGEVSVTGETAEKGERAVTGEGAETPAQAESRAKAAERVAAPRPAASQSEPGNGGSMPLANMVMALLAVIGMILAMAWLVKRFTGLTPLNNRQIRVIATLPVGARERLVVVEVGSRQLLLGVTPQNITQLHVLEEPLAGPGKPGNGDFAQRLQGLLKGDKA